MKSLNAKNMPVQRTAVQYILSSNYIVISFKHNLTIGVLFRYQKSSDKGLYLQCNKSQYSYNSDH